MRCYAQEGWTVQLFLLVEIRSSKIGLLPTREVLMGCTMEGQTRRLPKVSGPSRPVAIGTVVDGHILM